MKASRIVLIRLRERKPQINHVAAWQHMRIMTITRSQLFPEIDLHLNPKTLTYSDPRNNLAQLNVHVTFLSLFSFLKCSLFLLFLGRTRMHSR
jgi:hypothetical protein